MQLVSKLHVWLCFVSETHVSYFRTHLNPIFSLMKPTLWPPGCGSTHPFRCSPLLPRRSRAPQACLPCGDRSRPPLLKAWAQWKGPRPSQKLFLGSAAARRGGAWPPFFTPISSFHQVFGLFWYRSRRLFGVFQQALGHEVEVASDGEAVGDVSWVSSVLIQVI